MKAFILAGGLGTRLKSTVSDVPKPMAPVGGKPFLTYQIDWLKKNGITEIVFCIGYMADYIKNFYKDGKHLGLSISYAVEEELLGTAGAIKNAEEFVDGPFIVLNGDTYVKIDFQDMIKAHKKTKAVATIGLTKVKDISRSGSVQFSKDGAVTAFSEKKGEGEGYINGGVYIFEKDILDSIEENKKVSLEYDVFPKLIGEGLSSYIMKGYFIDIGRPETYKQLQKDILESILISEKKTVKDAMISIDKSTLGMALVVDDNKKLKGLVTDGDIRRFMIQEEDMHQNITKVMIKNPMTAKLGTPHDQVKSLFNPRIRHIPLLDSKGIVKDIVFYSDILEERKEAIVVRAKSPLRVSFTGGGTDIYQFFKKRGGYVLNSSINKFCRGTLLKRNDTKVIINSYDFEISETIDDVSKITYNGTLDLVKAVIKLMNPQFGFELHLYSDVPPGTGLGSSASIAAVVAGLLNHFKEEKLDHYQLSELIYNAEREEIDIKGGWQDQYATVFGGFNFMEFQEEEIVVHPLRIRDDIINELRSNLFLCYTGKTRMSGDIQKRLIKKQKGNNNVTRALERLKEITLESKKMLLKGNMEEFGKLLHEGWENKKRCDEGITDSYVNFLYDIGIKNGAVGGKLLGAGGGGYILFFCSPLKKPHVKRELEKADGKILDFDFDDKGLVTWAVNR